MRTLVKDFDISEDERPIKIAYVTDTHIGHVLCNEELLKQDIESIKNSPRTYWIHGGDMIDCIGRLDPRHSETSQAAWLRGQDDILQSQIDYFNALFSPIAQSCIALVTGNHEYAALKHNKYDVYRWIAKGFAESANITPESLMLGYQGFISFRFWKGKKLHWQCSFYCNHGYGGGRLSGGHSLTLQRAMGDYSEIDMVVMGHRHVLLHLMKTYAAPNPKTGGIYLYSRQGLFVPSYMNPYTEVGAQDYPVDGYAEHLGLPPQPIGAVPIILDPKTKNVRVILSSENGLNLD